MVVILSTLSHQHNNQHYLNGDMAQEKMPQDTSAGWFLSLRLRQWQEGVEGWTEQASFLPAPRLLQSWWDGWGAAVIGVTLGITILVTLRRIAPGSRWIPRRPGLLPLGPSPVLHWRQAALAHQSQGNWVAVCQDLYQGVLLYLQSQGIPTSPSLTNQDYLRQLSPPLAAAAEIITTHEQVLFAGHEPSAATVTTLWAALDSLLVQPSVPSQHPRQHLSRLPLKHPVNPDNHPGMRP